MRVALIVPGGVDRSGEERVIPALLWAIERLARHHDVHVFSCHAGAPPARYALRGALVHTVAARAPALRLLAAILAEHRRAPFDVLHAVWAWPGMVAGVAGRLIDRPVLTHLTGGDLADLPAIGYGMLRRWQGHAVLALATRLADRLTVPSEAMLQAARAREITATRLTYGVARDAWPPRSPSRRDVDAPMRLIHVASLNRVKDQPTLLAAAAELVRVGLRFHLDIVGADTLDGEIRRLADALRLGSRVVFHDFLPQHDLRPLIERADLLVHSSLHEADPIVLLEAASVGVPAVGTAVGHFVEWTPDAAVAVPVGDAGRLAGAIVALARDEGRRLELARAAQERGLARDADRTFEAIDRIYAEIARPVGPRRANRRTTIPVLGIGVTYRTDDAELMRVVEARYGAWRHRTPAAEPAVQIDLRRTSDDGGGTAGALRTRTSGLHHLEIEGRGSRAGANDQSGYAVAFVGPDLLTRPAEFEEDMLRALTLFLVTARNRIPVHGAALRRGAAGLVLTGPAGVGKSTLAHTAYQAGIDVLADDAVYVELGATPRVWGEATHVRFRPPTHGPTPAGAGERRQVAVDRGGDPPFVTHAGLCFLTRGATTDWQSIGPSEAVDILSSQAEPGFDRFRRELLAAAEVLTGRGAWRLTLGGTPEEAMPFIARMLRTSRNAI